MVHRLLQSRPTPEGSLHQALSLRLGARRYSSPGAVRAATCVRRRAHCRRARIPSYPDTPDEPSYVQRDQACRPRRRSYSLPASFSLLAVRPSAIDVSEISMPRRPGQTTHLRPPPGPARQRRAASPGGNFAISKFVVVPGGPEIRLLRPRLSRRCSPTKRWYRGDEPEPP